MHSQRIGVKKLAVTNRAEDSTKCYTWSNHYTTKPIDDSVQIAYYECCGCRSLRARSLVEKKRKLPTRKANLSNNTWIDLEPNNEHFYVITGKRNFHEKKFQAEAATGMRESPSAEIVRLKKKSPPSLQTSQLSVKKCVKQQWLVGMRFPRT
uniref:Uncharacterized protein n=1 Tax=Ditylenchus dipsaci TaxID=166011 RepID=A0A915EIH3_9BILA